MIFGNNFVSAPVYDHTCDHRLVQTQITLNSPGHRPQGVLRSTIIGLSDFFDNWDRLVGRWAENEPLAEYSGRPGAPWGHPKDQFFYGFWVPQTDTKKTSIYETLQKQPKWENESILGCPRRTFSPFWHRPFDLFKNGERVK